jgi:hypothetical protein
MDSNDNKTCPARYGGLLQAGQIKKMLRGGNGQYCYRGFASETNRLLYGQTFATRLKLSVEQEKDIYSLFLPNPEGFDGELPLPEEIDD